MCVDLEHELERSFEQELGQIGLAVQGHLCGMLESSVWEHYQDLLDHIQPHHVVLWPAGCENRHLPFGVSSQRLAEVSRLLVVCRAQDPDAALLFKLGGEDWYE